MSGGHAAAPDDSAALAAAARSLGLDLPATAIRRLVGFLDLLERWNRVYNLTAVRDRTAMRIRHLNDSLAILASLKRRVQWPTPAVLDVGSGAGLPGVVLALGWPEAQVTCVDAIGKKSAFVAQVASELGLDNLEARQARVEAMPPSTFDLVTARAFASLGDTAAMTRHLLREAGLWALAKGRLPPPELDAVTPAYDVFHVEQLDVPELGATRHLVWMRTYAPS